MYILMVVLVIVGDIFSRSNLIRNDIDYRRKFICAWSGTLMFLFSALHNEKVGIDMWTYYRLYKQDSVMSFGEILAADHHFEQGRDKTFHVLMHLLSFISDNPQIMIVFIGLVLSIAVCVLFYRYSCDPGLSLLMFICFREFAFTVTGLRQALAMAFTFSSIKYIEEKKPMRFFILVLIAGLFHASALVFVFAYPIARIRKSKTLVLSAIFASAVAISLGKSTLGRFMSAVPLLGVRFAGKIAAAENATSGTTMLIIYFVITLIGLYLVNREKGVTIAGEASITAISTFPLELNFSIITVLFCVMSFGFADVYRMASYYMVGVFLLMPIIMNTLFRGRSKQYARMIVILLITIQYILLGTGAGVDKYYFAWQ